MDWYELLKTIGEGCAVLLTIFGAFVGVVRYYAYSTFITKDTFTALNEKIDEDINLLKAKVITVEQTLTHQPTIKDIRDLSDSLNRVAVDVARISGSLAGLQK